MEKCITVNDGLKKSKLSGSKELDFPKIEFPEFCEFDPCNISEPEDQRVCVTEDGFIEFL